MRPGVTRWGATLAELLVALTLAAIVLGTATSALLRQQRIASELRGAAALDAQLRAATGAIAAELSSLGAASGDLVAGEAHDTALELRGLIAGGVACGDAVGAAILTESMGGSGDPGEPDDAAAAADAADAQWGAEPRVGDTLWWYGGDANAAWHGGPVTAADGAVLPCPLTGAPARPVRRLVVSTADTIHAGAPLRVTRPVRYAFYRSGDGSWQLGLREWVAPARRFAPPQPFAGPFLRRSGALRGGFRYFDAGGGELPIGAAGADVGRIARVRLTVLALGRATGARRDSVRRDSVDAALLPARRP
jgi:hypothetical protein